MPLGPLPAQWQPLRTGSGDRAYHHQHGGVISSRVLCQGVDDVPLDVLTNHLLFGIEERRELSRALVTLAGRAALRTRVRGSLDGVTVQMELVVSKKDGCTYDVQLISAPALFPARLKDFEGALPPLVQQAPR